MKKGFSLVEILMAVAILGLIAAIVVPQFNKQVAQSNIAKTKANLETLRTAIRLFYEQEAAWPMSDLSNLTVTMPSGMKYLPVIPKEGVTQKNTVVNIPDYTGGWWYDPPTHKILPNLLGTDANGDWYNTY
jgi:prepilin-type N-terminal cleavage/methylation domain-containing protein